MQEAFKTKVWGEREQTLTQGPGVTSGLGGRGWSPWNQETSYPKWFVPKLVRTQTGSYPSSFAPKRFRYHCLIKPSSLANIGHFLLITIFVGWWLPKIAIKAHTLWLKFSDIINWNESWMERLEDRSLTSHTRTQFPPTKSLSSTYLRWHSSPIDTNKGTCLPYMLLTCLFLMPHANYALNYYTFKKSIPSKWRYFRFRDQRVLADIWIVVAHLRQI